MSELSEETKNQIRAVEESMGDANTFFKSLQELDYDEVTTKLAPIDRARYDLTVLYAINSLFWMLKRSYGDDPQQHGIKGEMDRIKEQMVRLKQITDSSKRPRLNQEATKRIVRHELNIKKKRKTVHQENWENEKKDEGATK